MNSANRPAFRQVHLPLPELEIPEPEALHLWLVDTDSAPDHGQIDSSAVSHQQRLRQRRFKQRFYSRLILARYLRRGPARLRLVYSEAGKPFVDGGKEIQFSISHSRNWLALAVTSGQQIGVDIESSRENSDVLALARRYFSDNEAAWLESQPAADRQLAFNRLWVRKEAALKATGLGLAGNLRAAECGIADLSPDTDRVRLSGQQTESTLKITAFERQDGGIQAAVASTRPFAQHQRLLLNCRRS